MGKVVSEFTPVYFLGGVRRNLFILAAKKKKWLWQRRVPDLDYGVGVDLS